MNHFAQDVAIAIVGFWLGCALVAYNATAPNDCPMPVTTGDAVMQSHLDNSYYWDVRESTRALVRRRYKGDTTTARARAYFRHMDSAYDPTYALPNGVLYE